MKLVITLRCNQNKAEESAHKLSEAIAQNRWVQLIPVKGKGNPIPLDLLPNEPGVIIRSGGSSGESHQCLQPYKNLDQSAIATGSWLKAIGFEPKECLIFNPLPLHHISGLMPWWRSRVWGAQHRWLEASLMRNSLALEKFCKSLFKTNNGPKVISLVPIQLERLLKDPVGIHWLQVFDVIWVGGSQTSHHLLTKARANNIQLAPCYGTTETSAMVTVLKPKEFLAGKADCGNPLMEVELSLSKEGILKIRSPRIAKVSWKNGKIKPLSNDDGWWQSGDKAELTIHNTQTRLKILGRIDTAINSGGETVFPEQLETQLLNTAKEGNIPIRNLMFLGIQSEQWGQSIVALINWEGDFQLDEQKQLLTTLKELMRDWLPAERPVAWYECPELSHNESGKFEREKWKIWIANKNPIN